jgi:LPXTG-motif cell wall-anchored protein
MRRLAVIVFGGTLLVVGAIGTAGAKGFPEHAKVVVIGPGLPGGIATLGEDGAAFALGSGPWDVKWDAPNIGGSLEPDADLGPAFVVRTVLDCESGDRSRYRQRLYPDAPEGPQLFTPDGAEVCGDPAPAGYDALGPAMQDLLRSHGVSFHPVAGTTSAGVASEEAGGGSTVPTAAAVGAPFAVLALAGGALLRRRRRR